MAKIRLVKGSTSPTKRNFKNLLPTYLTYVNTAGLIILALYVIKYT